ncbi:MAG: hypoxanthine phosphoribosyltransferase [Deltaproteobacteria bacterium]|jgi:hypoxanthine phosphoribosyltransferase|nr:hypoxanthine phosphoribosyltransferase [Deltaproteobacteria bacterium]
MKLRYDKSDLNVIQSRQDIQKRVSELGSEISRHYQPLLAEGEMVLVVGVLNGAFIFMADLIRAMTVPLEVDFIRLSSYRDGLTSSSKVVMLKDLEADVKGRHVLVVEDVADCGLTLSWLIEHLKTREPASVKLAVAVDKKVRREVGLALDFVGFRLDDVYLIGYGLDAARRYREFPEICSLPADA